MEEYFSGMPVEENPRKISVVAAYEAYAEKTAKTEAIDEEPFSLGRIDEFDLDEIKESDCRCPIFVDDKNVYAVSLPLGPHEDATAFAEKHIENALDERFGIGVMKRSRSADVNLINLNHCGTPFPKQPDSSFSPMLPSIAGNRLYPSLVIEVGFKNENLDLLMREAEVWLNPATQTEYVLLIKIYPGPNRTVESIDIILCKRLEDETHPPVYFGSEEGWRDYLDSLPRQCIAYSKFGPKRATALELKTANIDRLKELYEVDVVKILRITKEDLEVIEFVEIRLDPNLMARGMNIHVAADEPEIVVKIPVVYLEAIFNSRY